MAGFDNEVLFADNWDFRGSSPVVAQVSSAGQLPIGTGGSPAIKVGTITSPDSSITVSYSDPDITIVANIPGINNWTEVTDTGPTSMVANNGYSTNNAAQVDLALPSSAAVGTLLQVTGKGAGGWIITQGAGQTIHFIGQDTTTGVGGSLASTVRYDCVTLRCITAGTAWVVEASAGNITVT